MQNQARRAAGAAAACTALALVAVVHHRLFGLRPSAYLTFAAMLLLFAMAVHTSGPPSP